VCTGKGTRDAHGRAAYSLDSSLVPYKAAGLREARGVIEVCGSGERAGYVRLPIAVFRGSGGGRHLTVLSRFVGVLHKIPRFVVSQTTDCLRVFRSVLIERRLGPPTGKVSNETGILP